jgi:hypothetical protein
VPVSAGRAIVVDRPENSEELSFSVGILQREFFYSVNVETSAPQGCQSLRGHCIDQFRL